MPSEGKINIKGGVALALNPPAPEPEGAVYNGTWLRIECDDEGNGFYARLFGQATYLDAFGNERQVTNHIDLADPGLEPIKGIFAQILEAYGPSMKNRTLDDAYKARQVAISISCPHCGHRPEHPPKECKTKDCKCVCAPKTGGK